MSVLGQKAFAVAVLSLNTVTALASIQSLDLVESAANITVTSPAAPEADEPTVIIPTANVFKATMGQTPTHLVIEATDNDENKITVLCGIKRKAHKGIERAPNIDRMTIVTPSGDQFSSYLVWQGIPLIETIDAKAEDRYLFQTITDPATTKSCAVTNGTGALNSCTEAKPFIEKELGEQLIRTLKNNCDIIFNEQKSHIKIKYVDPNGSAARDILSGHKANLEILL